MTLSYTYDGAGVMHKAAPTGLEIPTRAEMGEASFGGVPLEDPGATLTTLGHRPFTVVESACAQPRLFTGYVTERGIGRDLDRGMFVGEDARLHDVTIVDMNALFNFRVISETDGNRPEETWAERLTWLLASDYLSGLIAGTVGAGYIDTWPNPMDAADYRGGFPSAVLDDLAQRFDGAVNYFAFWNAAQTRVELFFDHIDQGIGNCTLSISNDWGDVDNALVFAPDSVAKLTREPDQTYSEVIVEYANGRVFRKRESTATTYVRRGTTISRPYTGKATTAQAQAEQFLTSHAVETDRITCSIQVPAASVGLIQAGMLMDVKFTHMPGYETGATMRIVGMSPKPTNDKANFWLVALELVAAKPTSTPPQVFQWVVGGSDIGGNVLLTWPQHPGVGDMFVGASVSRGDARPSGPISYVADVPSPVEIAGTDWTQIAYVARQDEAGEDPLTMAIRYPTTADDSQFAGFYDFDTGVNAQAGHIEFIGVTTYDTPVTVEAATADVAKVYPSPTVTTDGPGYIVWTFMNYSGGVGSWNSYTCTVSGETVPVVVLRSQLWSGDGGAHSYGPYFFFGYQEIAEAGDYSFTLTASGSIQYPLGPYSWIGTYFPATGSDVTDDLGGTPDDRITGETPTPLPDGAETDFVLINPYKSGSLLVYVDGIAIPEGQVTETDPIAGEFTLGWAPDADERITVTYIVG